VYVVGPASLSLGKHRWVFEAPEFVGGISITAVRKVAHFIQRERVFSQPQMAHN
jgi:hypothetical protein